MTVRVSCFVKRIISVDTERVMILNCSRVDCIIRRLHSSCDWSSNIFRCTICSKSDHLFVSTGRWSRRDTDMTVFESVSLSKKYAYRTLHASRYRWLLESVVSSKNLHLSCHRLRYVSAVWLDRDLLYDLFVCSWSMIISCQCQCLKLIREF